MADRFGRRIGKKKLTVGKLRPRHTAELLTTLSGMMIAVIVVSFYFLFSQEARDWAQEGHKIRQQRDDLLQEVGSLGKQKETLAREKLQLEAEEARLKGDKKSLDEKVRSLGAQAAANYKLLTTSEKRLAELQVSQKALEARRMSLEAQKNKIQKDLDQGKITLHQARASLAAIQGDIDKIKSQYNATIEEINSIQEKNDQLVRENAQLERDRTQAQKDKAAAEEAGKSRLAELDAQIQDKLKELDKVKFERERFRGATNYYAEAPLVFARGDELVRRDVPPLQSPSQAEALYESTLLEASKIAEGKGSRSKGDFPVVTLVPVRDPATGKEISPGDQQREVIGRLTNSDIAQVLIFRAGFNAFQSDPVIGLIEISPNPVVFRAGQSIADVRINGRLTEEEIFNQLSVFLRDEVSDQVRRAGMIPRSNQASSVGEVSALELLKLVEEIKGRNSAINVYALADDVTRASGPLKIRFRVR